jgi:L-lactate utilization protein LutC
VIDTFIAALERDGSQGFHVAGTAAARARVSDLLGRDSTLCYWSGDPLVMALDPASLGREAPAPEAGAGITGAAFGVAETGTLVLTYGAGRSRTTGLLPDLHIAVLAVDRLVATLGEAIAQVYADDVPRAMTLVTGASATSDIEKIRVTGAHGPRRVAVVIVG